MGICRMIGRTTLVVVAITLAVPLASCGSVVLAGPQEVQERDIAGVSALELRTSGDLTVTVGETESLTITAGSSLISSLTADVYDGTLVLDSDLGALGTHVIRYDLTVRSLDRVQITGSGSVSGASPFGRTGAIEIRGSGSATLTGVGTDNLSVTVVGSGDVTVEGTSESLRLTLGGSADVAAGNLHTKSATASLTGSTDARVHVSEDLDATVSGSSELIYTGDPAQITKGTTGSGAIVAD